MNFTADQSCNHAVSMSSKYAEKSEKSKNSCLNLLYTHCSFSAICSNYLASVMSTFLDLSFYFSKMRAMLYYMCCSFSCSVTLTDKEFYSEHLHLVQEHCKINSVCFYLNDHHTFCFVKNSMLLDSCTF